MNFVKNIKYLKKIDNLIRFNQYHSVDKKLRAYVHPIHVHKTPLTFPSPRMLKKPETYFQHLTNVLIYLISGSLDELTHQKELEFGYGMKCTT